MPTYIKVTEFFKSTKYSKITKFIKLLFSPKLLNASETNKLFTFCIEINHCLLFLFYYNEKYFEQINKQLLPASKSPKEFITRKISANNDVPRTGDIP